MSDKKFQRFGKYLILDHLVDGGMAKICRARYLGEQANKMVAVKMVQPQFSNDEAFVRMFQDELNITFGMLHPNIMQVYDYGKTNGQLYTAMEYIHGANLKQYLDRLKEKKVVFPVEITTYIISQVCLGLHYAHTFTDKLTGKPFNIVHRDISPHNIMLTYDGAVKVIDFGIAKAATNSEATQAGTIKGKLSYLAPEYLDGLELDARYDQFAVGITLWEMLCSRKLFQANNDLAVLKQIQACKITPPSEVNPAVPKELDQIVMKALSKDRSHRYENMDQLNRALVRFLYSTYPEFNASDLKVFADQLFHNEIEKDKIKFVEYGQIDIDGYINEMKIEESRGGAKGGGARPIGAQKEETRRMVPELELALPEENIQIDIESHNKTATKKLNKASLQTAKSTSRNTKLNSSVSQRSISSKEKTTSRVISKKEAASAKGGEESSSGSGLKGAFLVASFLGFLVYQSETVESLTGVNPKQILGLSESKSRSISSVETPSKRKQAALPVADDKQGQLILGGVDISMEVSIDGARVDYVGRPLKVPLNKNINVVVKKSGFIPYSTKVKLSPEKNSSFINIPELERARVGLLTTSQNYTAGSKLIYEEGGELIERTLPFRDVQIPEGTYHAKVVNPILGTEKKVDFTIEENKKHFLE